ncbi:TOMM precursor leader peptide-binding protein [Hyalangium rubrum]|uniref:TOMM leader peptide-binding protein n=1 Tax=Hyalangium rubrum TaxID=3103134 RepID=A0ABU5H6R3_9BACT|nr:TOMM precursor leader peptide-binding protein [Hyalangium sp. s54d21]MDY7228946.1 TOMM precursor leader peptide-binding protein [Hyalangium sp. s54d21]
MRDLLDRVLQFKPSLRLELLDPGRAFLLGEREQFMLTGPVQVRVASALDGRRPVREVIASLEGQLSTPEVLYTLAMLEKRGYVVDVAPALAPEVAAFWQAQGISPAEGAARLATTPVSVHALDGLDAAPLSEALRAAGLTVRDEAALPVVLVRDYLTPELESFNQRALERREPWLLVKASGGTPWVGPVFRPGEGACWACLAHRLRWNRPVETYLRARSGTAAPLTPPRAELPASLQAGAHLAAVALARWLALGKQGPLGQTLMALEFHRFQLTEHAVVRRPQCPACGDPELLKARGARPVVLEPRPRGFTEDNGFRSVTPEETFARLQHQISPITGVLSSIGPLEGRDHPLRPTFGASYFTPVHIEAPDFNEFHAQSMGKGRTPAQSRASALGEGIERWSALFQGDEPRIRARMADLGEEALHPRNVLMFSESQYRDREALNKTYRLPRGAIPLPFDERQETDWTPLWSLTHERRRYLPTACCYIRYPAPPEARFAPADSNGLAAGNCLEEAILQGFLELVERDAVSIWWYNRLRRPAVNLASFAEPYFHALLEHHRAHGWQVWALDLTHDLGIPTFAALGRFPENGRYCVGFGAHLDARIALQRALTEFNQLFDPKQKLPAPWLESEMEDPAYLLPDETVPARTPSDFPEPPREDIRDDVMTCVARAARVGLETLVMDLTRPDVGLHVAKVAVPGLRHFWPRFGPGRLYDVPVRLGWLSSPLQEKQLNPFPFFL